MRKPVFSTSHVLTSPAPAVVTLNCSLHLHVYDVSVPPNLLCYVRKVSPTIFLSDDLATTSRSHALIKKFYHFFQQLMISPRKSVFYDYNYEYKGVSLQASFSMFYHVSRNFEFSVNKNDFSL